MSVFRKSRGCICVIDKIIKKSKKEGAFCTNKIAQKFLSVAVSLVFAVCMVPGCPACAQVETQVSIPQEVFMTKDEIMQLCEGRTGDNSLLDGNDNDKKILLSFGTQGGSTEPITWLLTGSDDANSVVLLSIVPLTSTKCQFQTSDSDQTYTAPANTGYGPTETQQTVYANHWGASNLRALLQLIASDSNRFSTKEQEFMLPSTVTTKDTKNNVNYTTTDILYALSLPGDPGNHPSDLKQISAGKSNDLIVNVNYCLDRWCMSRFPQPKASNGGINFKYLSGTTLTWVDTEKWVSAAFKLNMENTLFTSAASHGTAANENFSRIQAETPMGLRINGSTELAGATVTATAEDKLTYSAPAGSRLIVIAATEDGSTYQFSKSIDTAVTNQSLDLGSVAGDLKGKTAAARAWIEKDCSGQLTYATEPISFSAEFILPTPPREFFKCTSPVEKDCSGQLTYATEPISFSAEFILPTPSREFFKCTSPVEKEYNGQKHEITVTSDVQGVGKITVNYSKKEKDGTSTPLSGPPINPGEYGATYDVGQGTNYGPAKGLRAIFVPQTTESN